MRVKHCKARHKRNSNLKIRERGQCAVYYTSPKNFIKNVFLFVGLTTLGTLVNFGWFIRKLSVQTFQPQISIYGNNF